jgi:hypothetical protein
VSHIDLASIMHFVPVWRWIGYNSSALQAIGAIVGASFAVLGFVVLVIYARDTSKIADSARLQSKDNVIPFLSLAQLTAKEEVSGRPYLQWVIENQGFGPAIKVSHELFMGRTIRHRPTIMQGTTAVICNCDTPDAENFLRRLRTDGFTVEYESIAGERLRSTFRILSADIVDVSFVNLSRE